MKLVKVLFLALLIACSGCISIGVTPEVQTTKQWENHYMTVEDFKNGTANIELDKDESIWVLSNSSLSRLLKNYINK